MKRVVARVDHHTGIGNKFDVLDHIRQVEDGSATIGYPFGQAVHMIATTADIGDVVDDGVATTTATTSRRAVAQVELFVIVILEVEMCDAGSVCGHIEVALIVGHAQVGNIRTLRFKAQPAVKPLAAYQLDTLCTYLNDNGLLLLQ